MAKNPILSMFGRSPIRPLQEHMATVDECVGLLIPFFEAVMAADYTQAAVLQESIASAEDHADEQKHALRMHLPRSVFLPVERRDLLEVLTMQDNIANRAKDIAGLMRGRAMHIPELTRPLFTDFVRRSADAVTQAKHAVAELDDLVEAGFRGPEMDKALALITEIDRIEKETDEIQIRLRATLRTIETELPPLDAMFLYKVIDWVGEVGDLAQRVGSRLQLLLAS